MEQNAILLVEDDPDDALLTLRALQRNGVRNKVVRARDGAEALDYLFARGAHAGRDASALPRLVLLDLRLPKIDGLEVLAALRANGRTRLLPVVILTSSEEDRNLVESHNLQANGFVRKPVEFERFADAVRRLGLHWLLLNEPSPTAGGTRPEPPTKDASR